MLRRIPASAAERAKPTFEQEKVYGDTKKFNKFCQERGRCSETPDGSNYRRFLRHCNNAGVLEHGAFARMNPQRHRDMIDLTMNGLTQMVACFAPDRIKRGSGRILNVASIAAFQPIPSLATCAASKAYVLSLTESLSGEFKGSGVSITALCPGVTATNRFSSAKKGSSQLDRLPKFLIGDAQAVAKEGFEACMRGDGACIGRIVGI
jgi:uncharacterized protein